METVRKPLNEDRVALLLGSVIFILALLKFSGIDMLGWAVKIGMWVGDPLDAWRPATKGLLPGYGALFATYAILTGALACCVKLMGNDVVKFVKNVKEALDKNDTAKARELCVKQKGCVASVVYSTLTKYEEMEKDTTLAKEQKLMNIQKELDEATALEMPSLQQNLVVIATMTTLGTLIGLLGTVIGMIKSFAALANAGSPDSVALSAGISEALVNTAFGIATGALAVISYNYFTSKIDKLTYSIDEVGFTIVQTYAATHK